MSDDELYYDPYDVDIDADPYPVYKRLRDEAPLYYNERLDFCNQMPVKAIGMLMGIPEADQPSVRDAAVRKLRNRPGQPLQVSKDHYFSGNAYAEYVAWRAQNPSDDLVTELLNVEFEDLM